VFQDQDKPTYHGVPIISLIGWLTVAAGVVSESFRLCVLRSQQA
jgi:hypothetical protein